MTDYRLHLKGHEFNPLSIKHIAGERRLVDRWLQEPIYFRSRDTFNTFNTSFTACDRDGKLAPADLLAEPIIGLFGEVDADIMIDIGDPGGFKVILGRNKLQWWQHEVEANLRRQEGEISRYYGTANGGNWSVLLNGKHFDHADSLKVSNHSPDGFAWGYGGSAPSQLALAILLHEIGNPDFIVHHYQQFKTDLIETVPQDDDFILTSSDVDEWLSKRDGVHINFSRRSSELIID
jgi:hypothetical protein